MVNQPWAKDFTLRQVLDAIQEAKFPTLKAVCEILDCSPVTGRKYIKKWVATRIAFQEKKEHVLDQAEETVYGNIDDPGTSKWLLGTLGKKRGFTERTEITGADGGDISVKYSKDFDGV